MIEPRHFEDLIGTPFANGARGPDAFDCFGLLLEVHRRMGFLVPDPFEGQDVAGIDLEAAVVRAAAGWDAVTAADAVPGDGVAMEWDGRPHVAILLPEGRILHALEGVGVASTRLTPAMRVKGYFRPRARLELGYDDSMERACVGGVTPAMLARGVVVRTISDVTADGGRTEALVPWDGAPLSGFLPAGWGDTPGSVHALVDGRHVPPDEWGDVVPAPGSEVIMARSPGLPGAAIAAALAGEGAALAAGGALTTFGAIVATAINVIIATGLAFVSSVLTAPQRGGRSESTENSPTYDLSGARNSIRNGEVIPVVYGEHTTGGQVIQLFNRTDPEGRTVLYMLLALSQGVIEAIAGLTADHDELEADQIPADITINGNPAKNYRGVRVSTRMGNTNQDSIPGFRDVVTAASIGFTMDDSPSGSEWDNAWRYETTQAVDGFEVNFHFPAGLVELSTTGNPGVRHFDYEVRWREKGTATWTVSGVTRFTAATRGPISTSYRKDGLTKAVYEVQVDRRIPVWPPTNPLFSDQSDIDSFNEIVSDDLAYPNVALLGIRAVATDQLSGQIPTILAKVKGKKVWVWDEVSETDPNYDLAWSQDPAWIAHDILTNDLYGLGDYLRPTDMVLSSFKTGSDFFATSVSDGRGGTHARGICNVVFDRQEKGWDAANSVLTPFRSGLVHLGRKVKLKVEQAYSTISQLFTPGNIVAGSLEVAYRDPSLAANIVEVQFWNEETDYEPDVATREDLTSLNAGDPVRKSTMTMRGVTHAARAARAAKFHLNVERSVLQSIAFEAPVDAVVTEPGDVFAFQHDVHNETNVYGGRVTAADSLSFTPDRTVVIGAGTYKASFRTSTDGTDKVTEYTIDSGAGTYDAGVDPINITGAWTEQPVNGDPYCIGPESTYRKLYRCTSVEVTQDLTVKIEGLEYDATTYTDDPGAVETFTDSLPDPRQNPTTPSNVKALERTVVEPDGSVLNLVDVSWQPDRGEECDVYIKRRGP